MKSSNRKKYAFRILAVVSVMINAFGQGPNKATMSAFGAEQFVLPAQDVALNRYFSGLYFLINIGSFLGQMIMPILRNLSCFGRNTCYTLPLGIVAGLSLLTPRQ
jgi:dipeptide/tripeptide permease